MLIILTLFAIAISATLILLTDAASTSFERAGEQAVVLQDHIRVGKYRDVVRSRVDDRGESGEPGV